jgi:putative tRNA adenosine deaminase-associated protein
MSRRKDVPYFAAALARTPDGWAAHEVDLDGVADVDDLADLIRDVDPKAGSTLLFVEEDDEYVAIVRVDSDAEEPRVFVSDGRAAADYPTVALLAAAVGTADAVDPDADDDEDHALGYDAKPLGTADLLADLGTPARALLAICVHEGNLPADVITEVCERAGCLDELEAIRLGA